MNNQDLLPTASDDSNISWGETNAQSGSPSSSVAESTNAKMTPNSMYLRSGNTYVQSMPQAAAANDLNVKQRSTNLQTQMSSRVMPSMLNITNTSSFNVTFSGGISLNPVKNEDEGDSPTQLQLPPSVPVTPPIDEEDVKLSGETNSDYSMASKLKNYNLKPCSVVLHRLTQNEIELHSLHQIEARQNAAISKKTRRDRGKFSCVPSSLHTDELTEVYYRSVKGEKLLEDESNSCSSFDMTNGYDQMPQIKSEPTFDGVCNLNSTLEPIPIDIVNYIVHHDDLNDEYKINIPHQFMCEPPVSLTEGRNCLENSIKLEKPTVERSSVSEAIITVKSEISACSSPASVNSQTANNCTDDKVICKWCDRSISRRFKAKHFKLEHPGQSIYVYVP